MERPEEKRPLGRPRRRWEDNLILRWIFRKWVGWGGGMDWIDLAQVRDRWPELINVVMNLPVP